MLPNHSINRASIEQLENDQSCSICQDGFSNDPAITNKSEQSFWASSCKAIYYTECKMPHLMHVECALNFLKTTTIPDPIKYPDCLPCPACRTNINNVNACKNYLISLKQLEEKQQICEDWANKINMILDSVSAAENKYILSYNLITAVKKSSVITNKTDSLNKALIDANWHLGTVYLARAKKYSIEQEVVEAISALSYCKNHTQGEQEQQNVKEKLDEALLLRLDISLELASKNLYCAYDKYKLLKELKDIFPKNQEVIEKLDQLYILHAKYRVQKLTEQYDERTTNFNIKYKLKQLEKNGNKEAEMLLAEFYLLDVRNTQKNLKNVFIVTLANQLKYLNYSIEHGSENIVKKAKRTKRQMPADYLDKAEHILTKYKLEDKSLPAVWGYLEYARDNGNSKVQNKAQSMLDNKENLLAENKKLDFYPDMSVGAW